MNANSAQPTRCTKMEIIAQLRQCLYFGPYAERLKIIHQHYYNSKNESRYRDALVEVFNSADFARLHRLRAYAEADKVDMVVAPFDGKSSEWVRVEIKYQFVFDLANRVSATLKKMPPNVDGSTIYEQLNMLPHNDLKRIVLDCIGPEPKIKPLARVGKKLHKKADLCDLFILIVQDRKGATHPDLDALTTADARNARLRKPLDERGVKLHFLNEQIRLEAEHDSENYMTAWIEPTCSLLRLIYSLRRFDLQVETQEVTGDGMPFPLTSYLFTLDFTSSVQQETSIREICKLKQRRVTSAG